MVWWGGKEWGGREGGGGGAGSGVEDEFVTDPRDPRAAASSHKSPQVPACSRAKVAGHACKADDAFR